MGFHRQEYGSQLPFPPPGGHPYPGNEPVSPILRGRFFTTKPSGKPKKNVVPCNRNDYSFQVTDKIRDLKTVKSLVPGLTGNKESNPGFQIHTVYIL